TDRGTRGRPGPGGGETTVRAAEDSNHALASGELARGARARDRQDRRARHAQDAPPRLRRQGSGGDPHGRRRGARLGPARQGAADRKSTRLNSSHVAISYAVFCLKKKKRKTQ